MEAPRAEAAMQVPTTYLTSTKNLEAILEAMRKAAEPGRFTTEFLKQLGYSSSSDRPLVPLLKAMGLLDDGGAPTERYRRFRDPSQSGAVLAEALRDGYAGVFAIDEEAHRLSPQELKGIFARLTGKHEGVVEKMAMTFKALAVRADFEIRAEEDAPQRADTTRVPSTGSVAAIPTDVHPLILGLLRELPPPGESFSRKRQGDWLEIAQATFRLIYVDDDEDEPRSAFPPLEGDDKHTPMLGGNGPPSLE